MLCLRRISSTRRKSNTFAHNRALKCQSRSLSTSKLQYDTEKFKELMRTKPFPTDPYPLWTPPRQYVKLPLWRRAHTSLGSGRYFTRKVVNRAIANLAPDFMDGFAQNIENAYTYIAQLFNEGRWDDLQPYFGDWSWELLSGYRKYLEYRNLGMRLNVRRIWSCKQLGSALLWETPKSGYDEELDLVWPSIVMQRGLMKQFFSKGFDAEFLATAIVWAEIRADESFEIYNKETNETVASFTNSPYTQHIWKFGTNLPPHEYKWVVIDMDNQVAARAADIIRDHHVFISRDTPRYETWLHTFDL